MRDALKLVSLFAAVIMALSVSYGLGFVTALRSEGNPQVARLVARFAPRPVAAPAGEVSEEEALALYREAWKLVRDEFYGEIPDHSEITYDAIRGSLRALDDPFTGFSDPVTTQVNSVDLDGEFEGIGAYVTSSPDGFLMIQTPMPGQPAEKAGIRSGDIVTKVDGEDITSLDVDEAVLKIRGPKGSQVELTILRKGEPEPLIFQVTRERIAVPSVADVRTLADEGAPELGYLHITSFAQDTEEQLNQAIDDLRADGARALVVDLRNNPGGYLDTAIQVTSAFIDEGIVVIQEDASGKRQEAMAEGGGRATDLPIVVLINRGSASASEIVAGALADYDRAVIVGETSFGKGSVQNVHTLSDKSELRVTIAAWLTPKGRKINKLGVAPDVPVTEDGRPFDANARDDKGRSVPEPTEAAPEPDAGAAESAEGDAEPGEPVDHQLLAAVAEGKKLLGAGGR